MDVWLWETTTRRSVGNESNGFSLDMSALHFEEKRKKGDLVFGTAGIYLKDANGFWDAEAFISRDEVSKLIKFLVDNSETFPEIAGLVLERLRTLVEVK